MKDFFKYLTVGEEDKSWGLYLNVAGKAYIEANSIYPSSEHPSGYYFDWKRGRILHEFQLNYITSGSGMLEDDFGKHVIKPGTLMILRPGIRHRYRPNHTSGWTENYIGFHGDLAHRFLSSHLFKEMSVIHCGIHEEIIDSYYKIFGLVKEEEPGFQLIASGLMIKLLGQIIALDKKKSFSGKRIEKVIQEIRFLMRTQLDQKVDLHKIAEKHHIGYAYLRKMFKEYTGLAPHKYYLDLKIMGARSMILGSDKSIKEISFELGFESIHYFSRLFKQKTGKSPSEFRKAAR